MGTELQRRDADTALPLWSARPLLRDPELVWTVHGDEVAAGADILTANTFRTHARSLAKAGLAPSAPESSPRGPSSSPTRRRPAPGREVFVAGSLSPLEDCYRPDLVPDDAALAREHGAQARFLADSGVDLILAETHNTIREAAAALVGREGCRRARRSCRSSRTGRGAPLGRDDRGRGPGAPARSRRTRSASTAFRPRASRRTSSVWRRRLPACRSRPTATWASRRREGLGLHRGALARATTRSTPAAGSPSAPASSAAAAERGPSTRGRCGNASTRT